MQDYQQRVLDEQTALADKLVKLTKFISASDAFAALPDEDKVLLREQRDHMSAYHDVLRRRIERFAF